MIVFLNPKIGLSQETGNRSMLTGLECVPAGAIKIKRVDDHKDFPLKIVIGRNFKYEGQKSSAGQWTWGIGTDTGTNLSNPWSATYTPKNAGIEENKGKGIILTTELPLKNSDFGLTRGKVKVSNTLSETGDADVKVFFIKNDINTVHSTTEPNWFFYWKQSPLIQNLLNISGITMYNEQTCTWDTGPKGFIANIRYESTLTDNYPSPTTYGQSHFKVLKGLMQTTALQNVCPPAVTQSVGTDYFISPTSTLFNLDIGPGCGNIKELFYGTGGSSITLEGIHVFYSLVAHETEHMEINCEIWQHADPNVPPPIGPVVSGFSDIWDLDNDGYKDSWEDKIGKNLQTIYPNLKNFATSSDDTYSSTYDQSLLGKRKYSAGTEYEEWMCYIAETTLIHSLIDVDDWSFDPTKLRQGKQYK